MTVFQIIFVPLLLGAAGFTLWQWLVHRRRRLAAATLVLLLGALGVAQPLLTQRVANWLGIGRGADLVGYLTALAVLGAYFLTLHSHRKLRTEMTELVRQLALRELQQTSTSAASNDSAAGPSAPGTA